jgi:deoxycytidylate deaminase
MKGRCFKQQVIAVIENNGRVYVGTNWCENPQPQCPRLEGEGYDKCKNICWQRSHAEVDAINNAGDDVRGGTLYLIGHTRICDNCQRVCNEVGIREIIFLTPPPKTDTL